MIEDNRRAQISQVYFSTLDNVQITDHLGSEKISIETMWWPLSLSKVEFKETRASPGQMVMQEFKATFTFTDRVNETVLRGLLSRLGLVRIDYTNEEKRVIGSVEFPVLFSIERSGSPTAFILSFTRSSPEFSKFL